jgi:hypothetical protein
MSYIDSGNDSEPTLPKEPILPDPGPLIPETMPTSGPVLERPSTFEEPAEPYEPPEAPEPERHLNQRGT